MSLPYRVSDAVEFLVLETGTYVDVPVEPSPENQFATYVRQYIPGGVRPIIEGGDRYERTIDVLIRADPLNLERVQTEDPEATVNDAIIFVGDATRQLFPLRPNESLNVRVSRRNMIFFRGGTVDTEGVEKGPPVVSLRLHVVTAVLNVGGLSS